MNTARSSRSFLSSWLLLATATQTVFHCSHHQAQALGMNGYFLEQGWPGLVTQVVPPAEPTKRIIHYPKLNAEDIYFNLTPVSSGRNNRKQAKERKLHAASNALDADAKPQLSPKIVQTHNHGRFCRFKLCGAFVGRNFYPN